MTTPRFRVWDREQKVWISDYLGFYITPEGKLFHESYEGEDEVLREVHHTLEEVMFSTNLKDKNGVEIFEGDVVKVGTLDGEPIGYIEWKADMACYKVINYINPFGGEIVSEYHAKYFEIIGNIYENPELLEKEE